MEEECFDESDTTMVLDDMDDELFPLEQEDDDGLGGSLDEEALEGFSSQCYLDGFSFPGDEKDWNVMKKTGIKLRCE